MPIHYTLIENAVLAGEGKYTARTHRLDPVEMADLVEHIVQRGSTVCRADILSVLEDLQSTIETLLLMGMSINTPTVNYRVGILGIFDGQGDSFDPSRHRIVARVSAGSRLRKAIRTNGRPFKDDASRLQPNPLEYFDVISGDRNKTLTPGEGALLTGRLLRFDGADPQQGVFFVAADGATTRAERILKVMPSEVTLIAPAVPAGAYTVEVRACMNGTTELRTGILDAPLTVS